jgi:hypothetical protein
MSRLHVPFRVLREAVRIIFVLKIGSGVASGFARVREDSDALEGLPAVLFRMAQVQESRQIWRRFGGGSARNRALLSRSCNSVQHMQMVQSRINTGYFASR